MPKTDPSFEEIMSPDLNVELPASILTMTGKMVSLTNPKPDDIDFEDIAHALSNICRFGGHASRFYSVAEHSVFVSHVVPKHLALHGLMHDAHEAYLGDVVSPLKKLLGEYAMLTTRWDHAISTKFGINLTPMPVDVKEADLIVLYYESQCLFPPGSTDYFSQLVPAQVKKHALPLVKRREVLCLDPLQARDLFIERCVELVGEVNERRDL